LARNGFFEQLVHFEPPPGMGPGEALHAAPHGLGWAVTVVVLCAIALASWLYRGPDFQAAEALKRRLSALFRLLERRYYLDDIFLGAVDLGDTLARMTFWFDSEVIDRIFVDGWGLLAQVCAQLSNVFDVLFIDRAVDETGGLSVSLGSALRGLVRRGLVQEYLMYAAVGMSLLAALTLSR
jgi:hypothetical protein